MSQIKHIILFIFTLTYLSAQVADTAAVSVPPQDDVAAPLTVAAPLSPDAMPTVAVLDFENNGLPAYEVESLVERLRSTVSNTGVVRLLDRKILEKILEEQGLQQSGCTTDECAAEVGQLLGAQYMIGGAIGKLGDTYTVEARWVSVSTGATERTESITYEGPVGGLVTKMEDLGWQIIGAQRVELETVVADTGTITVAILDFEPRGINALEAQTLTDRFATEINSTGRAVLVDRRQMTEVMQEQGYEQAGCTSEECAAEVGALLGVEFMINGAIGKLGDTYTIDVKMFNVQTGTAERTKNVTYTGPVDGMITEIEILAWLMMGLEPPDYLVEKQDKSGERLTDVLANFLLNYKATVRSALVPGWGQLYYKDNTMAGMVMGGGALMGFMLYNAHNNYKSSKAKAIEFHGLYMDATKLVDLRSYKATSKDHLSDTKSANNKIIIYGTLLGLTYATNVFHAYMLDKSQLASGNFPRFELAFNPELNAPQLRLSIALD